MLDIMRICALTVAFFCLLVAAFIIVAMFVGCLIVFVRGTYEDLYSWFEKRRVRSGRVDRIEPWSMPDAGWLRPCCDARYKPATKDTDLHTWDCRYAIIEGLPQREAFPDLVQRGGNPNLPSFQNPPPPPKRRAVVPSAGVATDSAARGGETRWEVTDGR